MNDSESILGSSLEREPLLIIGVVVKESNSCAHDCPVGRYGVLDNGPDD